MEKQNVRRRGKRRERMLRRLGFLFLALSVVILILVLVLRPTPEAAVPQTADALWDGSWYEDDLGRIGSDGALVRAMKAFEKKTGVKPFLSLQYGVDPAGLDLFAEEQYEALFSEGDHLLVVYDEWGEDAYYLAARTGAGSALGDADVNALLACIEKAYADPANRAYADAFAAGFREGTKTISPEKRSSGAGLLLGLGILLLALAAILVLFLRKKARNTEE